MTEYNFKTDLTFFTNEPNANLLDRFVKTLKDVKYFDILVGYFRSSGFFKLYKSFENIEKIRIFVGLDLDKKSLTKLEDVHLAQAINYLEVGLLINFGSKNLTFKRLANKKFKQKNQGNPKIK